MTVGIRFTLASGNVDFYDDEVKSITDDYLHDTEVQENQETKPYVYNEGQAWSVFKVEFIERLSTTKAKIDQLIDEEAEMTFYYDYAYSGGTNSSTVIFLPEGKTKRYHYKWGEKDATVTHKLTFLQSS